MKKATKNTDVNSIQGELQKIRKLLVLQLLAQGISEEIIEGAAQVGRGISVVCFPKRVSRSCFIDGTQYETKVMQNSVMLLLHGIHQKSRNLIEAMLLATRGF